MINSHPILFSGEMVRAILGGPKTQTRRVVKPQPEIVGFGRNCSVKPYCTGTEWPMAYYERRGACWNSSKPLLCPYGAAGGRLWVKETFAKPEYAGRALYRADYDTELYDDEDCTKPVKWKPSIFMPRWASRITLEITDVRVERLQDMTDDDAEEEGVLIDYDDHPEPPSGLSAFRKLWASINGADSWAQNPWVWVITFKMV